jgi:hypothetical protein
VVDRLSLADAALEAEPCPAAGPRSSREGSAGAPASRRDRGAHGEGAVRFDGIRPTLTRCLASVKLRNVLWHLSAPLRSRAAGFNFSEFFRIHFPTLLANETPHKRNQAELARAGALRPFFYSQIECDLKKGLVGALGGDM